MPQIETATIEITLKEINFNSKEKLALTFIVLKDPYSCSVKWAVSVQPTTISPISFFSSYEAALDDLHRRAGILACSGKQIANIETYGEIKGNYAQTKIKQSGFVIRTSNTLIEENFEEELKHLEETQQINVKR